MRGKFNQDFRFRFLFHQQGTRVKLSATQILTRPVSVAQTQKLAPVARTPVCIFPKIYFRPRKYVFSNYFRFGCIVLTDNFAENILTLINLAENVSFFARDHMGRFSILWIQLYDSWCGPGAQ